MKLNDRILVTGASGMVGRSLVKTLNQNGYTNLLTPSSEELDSREQKEVFNYFLDKKPSFIFHLAGHIGGIKANITRPVEFMYENMIMGMNVIKAAQEYGAERLLFVGSSCIYPRECPQPMQEEHLLTGTLEPTNEGYAIAKIAGIKLCEYLNAQFKTNFISLIPCNLYGFHDHFETENSHVVSALIYKMHVAKQQNASSVEVWGSGQTRREFLFVDDFSGAMIFFMKNWNLKGEKPYINIGSGTDQTVRELAYLIKDVVGFSGELVFNTSKPDGMHKKLLDVGLAKKHGWSSTTTLEHGLRKAYDWYLNSINENREGLWKCSIP